MSFQTFSLHQLGWRFNHAQHLTLADFEAGYPARVIAVHRSGLSVLSSRGQGAVVLPHQLADADVTVGDWVMVAHDADRVLCVIERESLIARVAAGSERHRQSIAANLDTLFIVTSCNDDFNPSRLARYLALALEADIEPVVVLTKSDLSDEMDDYVTRAHELLPTLAVVTVNATDAASVAQLSHWLDAGRTVAFVGSPGVGKSTLTHRLMGDAMQQTGATGEDDAHGRHTTRVSQMFPTANGAWVIDTPGMRELCTGPRKAAFLAAVPGNA